MNLTLISVILFASLLLLLATGIPIAFCMGGIAVLFTLILWSPSALYMIPATAYGIMSNVILTAIPLFIFMGIVLQRSGIAEDAYDMMYKWIGGVKGGMAIATIVICTIFAACTGISATATVSMGLIAFPAMLKRNYDKRIAVGCISAGGALGILIPPSTIMVLYCVFAEESVGRVFAGGVGAGLLLSSLFIVYTLVRCFLQPELGPAIPPEERATWKEKIASTRGVILPGLLVLSVLGTIFGGICTPTEAAAIGSFGSLVCSAIKHRFDWKFMKEVCYESIQLSGMVAWIMIGGVCFASLYTAIGALEFIKGVVAELPVSPYVILFGMQFIIFILGCLIDPGGIVMLTTPIFVPIITMLGFSPVWFGVLFTINMEMAYLTPPFGFNLFYMKSIVPKGISMMDIYHSIVPFVGLQAICLILCIIFPEIILWLPNTLFK
jgi:tripartite ATP-independent transporter DctM subunit